MYVLYIESGNVSSDRLLQTIADVIQHFCAL